MAEETHEVVYTRKDLLLWVGITIAIVLGLASFAVSLTALSAIEHQKSSYSQGSSRIIGRVVTTS